ncbi:uncharacterized protein FFE2_08588 [Fusarium fujikuroi]|nr:uncharacterized protein FFE2_08588 [Fusarium fujikuroi]
MYRATACLSLIAQHELVSVMRDEGVSVDDITLLGTSMTTLATGNFHDTHRYHAAHMTILPLTLFLLIVVGVGKTHIGEHRCDEYSPQPAVIRVHHAHSNRGIVRKVDCGLRQQSSTLMDIMPISYMRIES